MLILMLAGYTSCVTHVKIYAEKNVVFFLNIIPQIFTDEVGFWSQAFGPLC